MRASWVLRVPSAPPVWPLLLCSVHAHCQFSVDVAVCLDLGSLPALGRCPGEGNGCSLQYSGLEDPMDCIVHGVAESRTQPCDFHIDVDTLRWSGRNSVRKNLNCVSTFGNKPVNSLIFIHYFSPSVPVCFSLSLSHTHRMHTLKKFLLTQNSLRF